VCVVYVCGVCMCAVCVCGVCMCAGCVYGVCMVCALAVDSGQGSLACCSPWGLRVGHD